MSEPKTAPSSKTKSGAKVKSVAEPEALYATSLYKALDIPSGGEPLFQALHKGFRFSVYDKLAAASGLEKRQVAQYALLPTATLSRRAKSGHFSTEESDRLFRLTQVVDAAIGLFEGDRHAAMQWLEKPAPGLGNRTPAQMMGTSVESRAVLDLISQLEHGVIA